MELERRSTALREPISWGDPAYQAFHILRLVFVVAPLIAGLDKYLNVLVHWDQYLSPLVPRVTGIPIRTFMMIVGGIEIVAGLGVAINPGIFGYVIMGWLWAIILNVLFIPGYYDIALRDFGLSLGALALARLATRFQGSKSPA